MRPHHAIPLLLAFLTISLTAEPRFRADDGNFWHLVDNPALAAASGDTLAAGFAFLPSGSTWDVGTQQLAVVSPLLSFRYTWDAGSTALRFGSAMGPWEGVSFGYASTQTTKGGDKATAHDFGLLYRPLDLVSGGLTLDDAFSLGRTWGAGLGLRPLTLWSARADWLTLTADASWSGSQVVWERLGGRLSWRGSDLRVWVDPATLHPGFEATLALGPSETSASFTRAGTAVRWSDRTPDLASFGPVILKIQDAGALAPAPSPGGFLSNVNRGWNLPALVDLLDRAARSPDVAAVAFVEPPTVGGLAGAQDLAGALGRLRAAGKKVYIQADGFYDNLGFQGWIAAADRISLDPNGSLGLGAGSARRIYLKGFLDKIGVRFHNFAPWETKSANNTLTFDAMPDGERAMLKRFLTDQDDLAARALASGRGDRLKGSAPDLVAGGPYLTAQEALDLGLVDSLENRASFDRFLSQTHPGSRTVDHLPADPHGGWGPPVTRRTVALVHLAGPVVMGPGQAGTSIGRAAAETLASLRDDASIRAVVLRVDSPGGAVLPSDALADEVKRTVEAGKPVLVVMGDVAASGGYYLAAPATRIWAQSGTLTGSIGVTATSFDAAKALDLLGLKADGVDLAPGAAFGDWTRDLSEADGKKWAGAIEAIYQRFLDVVATGRHLDKAVLEPLARGQIYTGREALALGLVDALGGQDEVQKWLEKDLGGPVEWEEYLPGESDPFGGLLSPLVSAAVRWSGSPALKLAASVDRWVGPEAQVLAGIAAMGPGPLVWADLPASIR